MLVKYKILRFIKTSLISLLSYINETKEVICDMLELFF